MVFQKQDSGGRMATWCRQTRANYMANVESKSRITDILSDLKIPPRTLFSHLKKSKTKRMYGHPVGSKSKASICICIPGSVSSHIAIWKRTSFPGGYQMLLVIGISQEQVGKPRVFLTRCTSLRKWETMWDSTLQSYIKLKQGHCFRGALAYILHILYLL